MSLPLIQSINLMPSSPQPPAETRQQCSVRPEVSVDTLVVQGAAVSPHQEQYTGWESPFSSWLGIQVLLMQATGWGL